MKNYGIIVTLLTTGLVWTFIGEGCMSSRRQGAFWHRISQRPIIFMGEKFNTFTVHEKNFKPASWRLFILMFSGCSPTTVQAKQITMDNAA